MYSDSSDFKIKEYLQKILKKNGFSLDEEILENRKMLKNLASLGIRDILITFNLFLNNFIEGPIIFNLYHFLMLNKENIEELSLRIKLIKKLVVDNSIDIKNILFVFEKTGFLNSYYDDIKTNLSKNNWQLNIKIDKELPKNILPNNYIVFYTNTNINNYDKNLYKNIKYNIPIVLLGSRKNDSSSIYNDLKKNNKVIDLTEETIDKVDFQKFLNKINILKNSYGNILIGNEEPLYISLSFNSIRTLCYIDEKCEDIQIFNNNLINDVIYNDYNLFRQKLMNIDGASENNYEENNYENMIQEHMYKIYEIKLKMEEENMIKKQKEEVIRKQKEKEIIRKKDEEIVRKKEEEEMREKLEEDNRKREKEEIKKREQNELRKKEEEEIKRKQEEEAKKKKEKELRKRVEEEIMKEAEENRKREQEEIRKKEEEIRKREEEIRQKEEEEKNSKKKIHFSESELKKAIDNENISAEDLSKILRRRRINWS